MIFEDIKLIIWDLDETLWNGTLSDGKTELPEDNKKLLFNMLDAGVISSICSKNDLIKVNDELIKKGIKDCFVFNSINWSPKGERVSQIIKEMNLRAANVMFIDDNPLNRSEVLDCCSGITVEDVDVIPQLITFFSYVEKKDIEHNRLKQYRLLETKAEFKAITGNNERFLQESEICVSLYDDCLNNIDRISELILRSNQLNFTKVRSTKKELEEIINNINNHCGYVKVKDRFGDYGIVGFYTISEDRLLHFVFSCRTLGMGVEQYVYKVLGCPAISIVGEVSSDLMDPDPTWINNSSLMINENKEHLSSNRILIKGPCDMQQMFAYIAENRNIQTEFVYVNKHGVSIEQGNHSIHIVQSLTISKSDVRRLSQYLPFGDDNMYSTNIFDESLDFVVYSLFTDPNLGMYRERDTGIVVAFGEYITDFTDEKNWDNIIKREVFVANCNFSEFFLKGFSEKFEFLGRITVKKIVENLDIIYNHIGKETQLVLVLGSEHPFIRDEKPAYVDRHIFHKELNEAVRKWSSKKGRVKFIDINEIATSPSDYAGNINHFTRSVYYRMSKCLVEIVESNGGTRLKQNGEFVANLVHLKRKIKKVPSKINNILIRYRFRDR